MHTNVGVYMYLHGQQYMKYHVALLSDTESQHSKRIKPVPTQMQLKLSLSIQCIRYACMFVKQACHSSNRLESTTTTSLHALLWLMGQLLPAAACFVMLHMGVNKTW